MEWIEINDDSNLPEKRIDVLVTVAGNTTAEIAWLASSNDWVNSKTRYVYEKNDVIAWMYLPKIFKKI